MEFVKYIINCFKVYYPKFLCKFQESFKSESAATVPVSFIQSLSKLYRSFQKNHPNHHRHTFCPFLSSFQPKWSLWICRGSWMVRNSSSPPSIQNTISVHRTQRNNNKNNVILTSWTWTLFFFSGVENCEVVVGPRGDQQAQVCLQNRGPDVHRARVSAAAHGWNGTCFQTNGDDVFQ